MHHLVLGERLRTSYANAPSISMTTEGEQIVIVLSFSSSVIDEDGFVWKTAVAFHHVLDLHLYEFNIGLPIPNRHDFQYALIEIEDSETITRFAETGVLRKIASPVLVIEHLHHYRIAFDDHGTYDIVCTEIDISYSRLRVRR